MLAHIARPRPDADHGGVVSDPGMAVTVEIKTGSAYPELFLRRYCVPQNLAGA